MIIYQFRSDWLTIYDEAEGDAASSERIMCGSYPPNQILLKSNKGLLNFHSDSTESGRGFRIKIEHGNFYNILVLVIDELDPMLIYDCDFLQYISCKFSKMLL